MGKTAVSRYCSSCQDKEVLVMSPEKSTFQKETEENGDIDLINLEEEKKTSQKCSQINIMKTKAPKTVQYFKPLQEQNIVYNGFQTSVCTWN